MHWFADVAGCDPAALADVDGIAALLRSLADDAGLTRLGEPVVHATPAGLVGMVLLAESHASVHTDVAAASAFVDVFSCVDVPPDRFEARVRQALGATSVHTRTMTRATP